MLWGNRKTMHTRQAWPRQMHEYRNVTNKLAARNIFDELRDVECDQFCYLTVPSA